MRISDGSSDVGSSDLLVACRRALCRWRRGCRKGRRRADRTGDRPMMLGDMLAAARKSAGRFQAWLEGSNPALAAQVVERAAIQGFSPAAEVRVAVADFALLASEEGWAQHNSRSKEETSELQTLRRTRYAASR